MWIRIRNDLHSIGTLDPDPHWDFRLDPGPDRYERKRIRNTAVDSNIFPQTTPKYYDWASKTFGSIVQP